MRKLAVLFVFMSLLLLGGSQHLFARTSQISTTSSHTLEKKHRVKFTNQDSSNSLIEEADLGIDEDHSGGDINDKLLPSKTFTGNYSLLSDWYLTFSNQSLLKSSYKNFKIFAPFCGQSNPIYITLRVLRI